MKISTRLALCFGELGASILNVNLLSSQDKTVNMKIAGSKKLGIYGYVDILNLDDFTDVLEEKVLNFINEISEIVHNID